MVALFAAKQLLCDSVILIVLFIKYSLQAQWRRKVQFLSDRPTPTAERALLLVSIW